MSEASKSDAPILTPPTDMAELRANVDKVFRDILEKDPEKVCRWICAVILDTPSPDNPLHEYWLEKDKKNSSIPIWRRRYKFLATVWIEKLDGKAVSEFEVLRNV